MRVEIPNFDSKKELYSYLKKNKKDIISKKKHSGITSDSVGFGVCDLVVKAGDNFYKSVSERFDSFPNKTVKNDDSLDDGKARVGVLANITGWDDSHDDVLIPGCYTKTIGDKGASNKDLVYHLENHNHSTTAIIGGDVKMTTRNIDLSQFNVDSDIEKSEGLIGSSTIRKDYDEKHYFLYIDDEIKNHSIGLRYVSIFLCLNSDDDEHQFEKENWDKYYNFIINKEKADKRGFFWAVTEIQLLEYSCVLWGSSELTTVQEISKASEPFEEKNTPKEKEAVQRALREKQVEYLKLLK